MTLKTSICILLYLVFCFAAHAQKLPNIQKNSVWAPPDVKIDGKTDEWDNKFQAYNHATEIYYTIANDDSRLYIIIQATDAVIIKKILYGNITFTIGASAKDNKGPNLAVTFPSLSKEEQSNIIKNKNQVVINSKSTAINRSNDSLITILNAQITDKSSIKLTGMPTLPDSSISINKNSDIKAMALFGKGYAYTYELAIPFKYLETAIIKDGKFKYNIKLNGLFYNTNTTVQLSSDAQYSIRSTPGYASVEMKNTPETLVLDYPTDFWGEYVLTKKK